MNAILRYSVIINCHNDMFFRFNSESFGDYACSIREDRAGESDVRLSVDNPREIFLLFYFTL